MSVEIETSKESLVVNDFEQRLVEKLKSYHFNPDVYPNQRLEWFESRVKYRQFHENLCQYLREYQVDNEFQDFINLLIHYVESYHHLVALKLGEIH